MSFARCPLCDDILNVGQTADLHQPVTCPTCLANLKIVSLEPLELEEAMRRPARPPRNNYPPRPQNQAGPRRDGPGNWSGGPAPMRDRRPYTPTPQALPPNPDKQVDSKRAQKWEKPKQQVEDDEEVDKFEEFEDKLGRSRGGKGKRGK